MQIEQYMNRTLELASNGIGYTSPNPMVGAVIVKGGRIIGEGFHKKCGKNHAEIDAIENATEPVAGAALYCNLEPCSHDYPSKRTPPCTRQLISEKIKKVYISTIDPNPHVNGNGIAALRDAGIEVTVGRLAEKAIKFNEAYFKYVQTGLPFVNLKIAMSLDGRIATHQNDSRWITNESARSIVHQMRHQHDAVLVGANTAFLDNPRLTVRHFAGKQPLRIVLDSNLKLPKESHLLQDEFREQTLIFTTRHHDKQNRQFAEYQGARVVEIEEDPIGRINLKKVLKYLGQSDVSSLLVEGGAGIFTEFIKQSFFDKLSIFYAPILIGKGVEAVGDLNTSLVSQALRLEDVSFQVINDQMFFQGYRKLKETFGALHPQLTGSTQFTDSICLPVSLKN